MIKNLLPELQQRSHLEAFSSESFGEKSTETPLLESSNELTALLQAKQSIAKEFEEISDLINQLKVIQDDFLKLRKKETYDQIAQLDDLIVQRLTRASRKVEELRLSQIHNDSQQFLENYKQIIDSLRGIGSSCLAEFNNIRINFNDVASVLVKRAAAQKYGQALPEVIVVDMPLLLLKVTEGGAFSDWDGILQIATQQRDDILRLENNINLLREYFYQLQTAVLEGGETLEEIAKRFRHTHQEMIKGQEELAKAKQQKEEKNRRKIVCIIIVVVVILVVLLVATLSTLYYFSSLFRALAPSTQLPTILKQTLNSSANLAF